MAIGRAAVRSAALLLAAAATTAAVCVRGAPGAADLMPFLGVGLLHVEVGLRLRSRRPESRMGLLMIIAGGIWLADEIGRQLTPGRFADNMLLSVVYGPIMLHCALIIPVGRLTGTLDRRVAWAGYLFWPVLVGGHRLLGLRPAGLAELRSAYYPLVGAALVVFFVVRYHLASPLYRRSFTPFWTAMVANTVMTAVAGVLFDAEPTWSQLALCAGAVAVPLGAAGSLARSRPPGTTLALVAELGRTETDRAALRASAARALSDPTARILLPDAAGILVDAETGAAPAAGSARTVLYGGSRVVGAIAHDPAVAASPDVLAAVQRMVALVLANQLLLAEVEAQLRDVRDSRRRIVEAGDAERRRVERNVHDGVQQRLIAASLLLHRGQRGTGDPALVRQGAAELDTAIGELREIVRGLNPSVLAQHGLLGAVESIAERSAVAVTVEDTLEREVPADLAVTAYYVTLEAVANAEKHAAASVISVRLANTGSAIRLTVRDDGAGRAGFVAGGGLIGVRDRVEACGGTLDLCSPPGSGTTLTAVLPLAAA
ncbi:sensor histidine kinase [Hamadaea tsunoensis]|uniref:sensor histidine kinase n=1 Tax=Hamadaea tsunoensis TaxID=53368 RepID=UPI0012F8170D|nr:ATP-binding protein [Hamadaea tsunoensis]